MPDFADFHPCDIPAKPGVYVYRDRFGKVIYVGKARNLRRRMSSYFQPSRSRTADPKLRSLIGSIATWNFETVKSEEEALILESRLIKAYAPHYNILLRDDKRYLLLKIDWTEAFPTLTLARIKKPGNFEYFGPFPNGSALRYTLEFLLRRFGLRACRDSEPNEETRKHCLKRTMRDCCAPCTGAISREDYLEKLNDALDVLHGDIAPLKAELEESMRSYSEENRFELAARQRDILANLEAVFGRRNRSFERPELPDAPQVGLGAVEALGEVLKIPTPRVIIGFDISNTLGTHAVASLVCFRDGRPDRKSYRKFKIKTVFQSDDFSMMKEAVTRHFRRLMEENRDSPDLVMVDGGRGQLNFAIAGLCELNCPALPVIGLAERNEEIYVPGIPDPLVLDRHNPALRVLQALRDEAHRFAITFHRELRDKAIEHSMLDDVPGVGATRKAQLIREFGSVAAIRESTAEEIARRVPGTGLHLAQRILDHLVK
ncbi:MAG: excinuclease ABC subunit UvrC [Victivallaceae bacterium]|nr:excinuclease ABC subunit UvrC [Victivallaceae bacterium]